MKLNKSTLHKFEMHKLRETCLYSVAVGAHTKLASTRDFGIQLIDRHICSRFHYFFGTEKPVHEYLYSFAYLVREQFSRQIKLKYFCHPYTLGFFIFYAGAENRNEFIYYLKSR